MHGAVVGGGKRGGTDVTVTALCMYYFGTEINTNFQLLLWCFLFLLFIVYGDCCTFS